MVGFPVGSVILNAMMIMLVIANKQLETNVMRIVLVGIT